MVMAIIKKVLYRDAYNGFTIALLADGKKISSYLPAVKKGFLFKGNIEGEKGDLISMSYSDDIETKFPAELFEVYMGQFDLTLKIIRRVFCILDGSLDNIWKRDRRNLIIKFSSTETLEKIERAYWPYISMRLYKQLAMPFNYIERYVNDYGLLSLEMLKNRPIEALLKMGVPFQDGDKYLIKRAVLRNNRIKYCLTTALNDTIKQGGSTLLTKADLVRRMVQLIPDLGANEIYMAFKENGLTEVGDYLKCQRLYQSESFIAQDIDSRKKVTLIEKSKILSALDEIEKKNNIHYAQNQKEAFKLLESSGIKVLTGGPGTGKTTVLKGLLQVFAQTYGEKNICLCAPTGRAAQRMAQSTAMDACTIHHLMAKRAPIDALLVCVDESSMLDTDLFAWIIAKVRKDAILLLVGDVDQLPSIGPGQILRDVLEAPEEKVERCRLRETFRNAGVIVENAYKINVGDTNLCEQEPDFTCVYADELAERICDDYVNSARKNGILNVQALCPIHKGDIGIAELNHRIQERINPQRTQAKLKFGATCFREGDKVIFQKNNPIGGYYNGDIGIILSIGESVIVDLGGNAISVEKTNLTEMALGYAISIHKSQGSEFKDVLICLPDNCALCTKNLLYTAVTRAKKKVTIYAKNKNVVDKTIKRLQPQRNTCLKL